MSEIYIDELLYDSELILPLGITLTLTGEKKISSAKETLFAAEYLDSLDEDKIFTESTVNKLKEMLSPLFGKWGYDIEIAICREFTLDKRERINKKLMLDSTEPLLPDCGYENLTDCEPDPLGEGALCFGTVIDGKIVSAASENPRFYGESFVDIGVETAEGYENNGYAASNVAALAYYLLDPGVTLTYTVESDNTASLRIAEKVGFAEATRELRVIGRK